MRKHNPENERVKREYLLWLRNAQGRSEATLDIAAAAIHRFEAHIGYRTFKTFRREQAISFKGHLATLKNEATGKPLSKATLYGTLKAVRAFFEWLSREPGYRKGVHSADAAYFKLTDNDARAATAVRQRPAPSVAQVWRVIESMPNDTTPARRDRALIALMMLTGARDAAVASLKLRHLDLARRTLFQDPRDVKTKRAKTISTLFFPVGPNFEAVVAGWVDELRDQHLFGPDDPLFPATKRSQKPDHLFAFDTVERRFWTSAGPIRSLFKRAFTEAGVGYFHPHSLRRTLMHLAWERKVGHKQLAAWGQNLGHDSLVTSIVSYGRLSFDELADVMNQMASSPTDETPDAELMEIARQLVALRNKPRH